MKTAAIVAGIFAAFGVGIETGKMLQHNKSAKVMARLTPVLSSAATDVCMKLHSGEITTQEEVQAALSEALTFVDIAINS